MAACKPELLKSIPLFALLDDDEAAVLGAQVDVTTFAAHERIYSRPGILLPSCLCRCFGQRYARIHCRRGPAGSGCRGAPQKGRILRVLLRCLKKGTPHQATSAFAVEETECVEVSRQDILTLLQQKPHAVYMDMLTTLGHQLHLSQQLVRLRSTRNPK